MGQKAICKMYPKPKYGWLSCHLFYYSGTAGLEKQTEDQNVRRKEF